MPLVDNGSFHNMPKKMPRRPLEFRAWDGHRMFHVEQWEQLQSPDLVIMQFTGLIDVDGKKIFDKDIVASLDDGITCVVAWDFKHAGFRCDNKRRMYGIDTYALQFRRVIGNIWENRDILKPLGGYIW